MIECSMGRKLLFRSINIHDLSEEEASCIIGTRTTHDYRFVSSEVAVTVFVFFNRIKYPGRKNIRRIIFPFVYGKKKSSMALINIRENTFYLPAKYLEIIKPFRSTVLGRNKNARRKIVFRVAAKTNNDRTARNSESLLSVKCE